MDYPGCLLVVSHDRYFMDKIVDHLFIFRGAGEIEDFPGNYSDFRAYEDSVVPEKEPSKEPKNNWKQQNTLANKLTFTEQKEYQKLEKEIAELELQKKEIEHIFSTESLSPEAIEQHSNNLKTIIKTLEEKEERWFELSDKFAI
jgi:ATP-binding cassette subfamily F protein uup